MSDTGKRYVRSAKPVALFGSIRKGLVALDRSGL
jgi:hypothetical protein